MAVAWVKLAECWVEASAQNHSAAPEAASMAVVYPAELVRSGRLVAEAKLKQAVKISAELRRPDPSECPAGRGQLEERPEWALYHRP